MEGRDSDERSKNVLSITFSNEETYNPTIVIKKGKYNKWNRLKHRLCM